MASRPLPLASGAGVRRACAGACLLALLAGCGGGAAHFHHITAGILHGAVTRGPTSPFCRNATPCSAPARGAVLVFTTDGRVAARVVAGKGGGYSVFLAQGVYTVAVLPLQVGRIEPATVRVASGETRTVDFTIDTGLR